MSIENESSPGLSREDASADTIVVECDLPDPPEKVWRALTVPELLAAWLMPNDIRPRVGERFRFESEDRGRGGAGREADGPTATGRPGAKPDRAAENIDCEVLEVEPNRVLRYRWSTCESDRVLDSVVSFELTRTADGGTHLRVVHGDFQFRAPNVIRLPVPDPVTTPGTGKPPVAMLAAYPTRAASLTAPRRPEKSRLLRPATKLMSEKRPKGSFSNELGGMRWAA